MLELPQWRGRGPGVGGCLLHWCCLGGLRHVGRGAASPLPLLGSPPLPGPRALAQAQESHIISGCFQLPQQGAGLPPSRTGHIWNPLPRGVGGRIAGCGGLPGPWKPHSPRPQPQLPPAPAPSDRRGQERPAWGPRGRGRAGRSVPPSGRGPPREEPGGAGECLWPGLPASRSSTWKFSVGV